MNYSTVIFLYNYRIEIIIGFIFIYYYILPHVFVYVHFSLSRTRTAELHAKFWLFLNESLKCLLIHFPLDPWGE